MGGDFFTEVTGHPVRRAHASDPLAFKVYEPDRLVLGKRMEDHLRIGVPVALFVGRSRHVRDRYARPPLARSRREPMSAARQKMAVAFEFIEKLGVPYCFHDRDVAPEGASFAEFRDNLDALTSDALGHQERTGARLLWGTANLFTHPRYQGGAATNPDPEVFAYAAAQVKHMLEVTQRLGGTNYVLWGGRGVTTRSQHGPSARGRPTRPVPSPRRRAQAPDRVRGHAAHRAGRWSRRSISTTTTRRRSTASSFATRLEDEYRLNIEANHATLAGHSFHHEVAYAVAHGILGSIDANRGDPQNGWDTDQFPNSVEDLALPIYEILRGGGFGTGGFNFDAKLRRQSTHRTDLFLAHIGGIDTLARALLVAAELLTNRTLADRVEERRWSGPLGTAILDGRESLASLEAKVASGRSTRDRCPGTRSCSRTWSTRRSGRRTSPLASSPAPAEPGRVVAYVLGIDASTTRRRPS